MNVFLEPGLMFWWKIYMQLSLLKRDSIVVYYCNAIDKEMQNKQIESSINISEENNIFVPQDVLCDARNVLSSLLPKNLTVTIYYVYVVYEVNVLWNSLQSIHMQVPSTEDVKKIADDFNNIWNFPHCGAPWTVNM